MKRSGADSILPESRTLPMVGMVGAFRWEVEPLLRNLPGVKRLRPKRYSFFLGGEPVVLSISGMGMENALRAAEELVQTFPLRGLVMLGFAGALVESLRPGDVVLADQVIEQTTGERFDCQTDLWPVRFAHRGKLLMTDRVIRSAAEKRQLGQDWGAVAVDTESAGVARAAGRAGLPFAVVRSITDSSEQSIFIDFERCRREDGQLSWWKIVGEAMTTPEGIRDVWRFARSSRQAAASLAAALL